MEDDSRGMAEVRQRLGHEPDFVVTRVTAPPSVTPGSTFQSTVEVCNRGGVGSGVDLNLYFSDDDAISPSDFWATSLYVGYLSPGQCQSQPVTVSAYVPTDGPWYLGAYADPHDSLLESDESNNGLASEIMGIGYAADFVVTSVTGPASAQFGQSITTQVTVCNRGTQSDYADISVYLSADNIIRADIPPNPPEDSFLGSAPSVYLYPGQCSTTSVLGSANPPPPGMEGPYFIGAVADPYESRPELIESNNALAGDRMGVGSRADFVITSVTGPASAQFGQSITAQVTVCNHGTQADAAEVGLYLSADDIIGADVPPNPPEDSFLGSAYVGYLSPGQCRTQPISGSANPPPPGMEGPYFIGAVADPYESRTELIEDNNALAGYRMGVGNGSDFVITSVTGPASAQPGQSITTQVTICNHGTQAASTEVEVYLSTDSTIRAYTLPNPPEDSYVGSAGTGYLQPGQCRTVAVSGSAHPPPPGTEGPYFVGAVADPYGSQPELIEDNNALAGYRMGVGYRGDFVVTSVTGPASAQVGQSISAQVTVCNRGTQADSTEVGVYVSADNIIRGDTPPGPPEDYFLGSAPTGHLYPGQCTTTPVSGNVYPPPPGADGPYFIGAIADPYKSRTELIEDNNALAGYRMGLGLKADFVITSATGPNSVRPGNAFTMSVGICNRGQQADTVDVDLYLSADTDVRVPLWPDPSEDSYLGTISSVSLAAGACSTRSLSVTAPSVPEGAYYLGAVADAHNLRVELIEDNNSKAGNVIGVGYSADFLITSVTGPSSVKPNTTFTMSTTVCNRGQLADTVDVELYLSPDNQVRAPTPPAPPEDFYLGTITNISLAVGACSTRSLSVTAPSVVDGAYYLGAVADAHNQRVELIEDNNAKVGNVIGVGYRADFVITSVTGPSSVVRNAPFSASVTVCNRGQVTDSVEAELYFSSDATIRVPTPPLPPEDFYLGTLPAVTLAPGACSTRSLTVNANVPTSGRYYLGAVADPYNSRTELIEDNNTRAGTYMTVNP
jgi:subtilase family serine protease